MLRCRRYSSVTVLDSQYDRQPLASCCFSICPPIALIICRTPNFACSHPQPIPPQVPVSHASRQRNTHNTLEARSQVLR